MSDKKKTGLELLREPFPAHLIGKLPKPTKKQKDEVKADFKKGIRCDICGGWHHPKVVHLDYVGHAALTDRLLDCDIGWNWEPFAVDDKGLPAPSADGGLWLRLTVCGVTRAGYGDAQGKKGGDAIKELIGDGLRNAAMRFGAALDLWHKGDLHVDDDTPAPEATETKPPKQDKFDAAENYNEIADEVGRCTNPKTMGKWFSDNAARIEKLSDTDKERLRLLYKQYADIFKKDGVK